MNAHVEVHRGDPWPLGAHVCCDGTNFAVFTRHAASLELWLFENVHARAPWLRIPLDPTRHRTGDIWHARVSVDLADHCYVFRATGSAPAQPGQRFDAQRLLLDPYASLVATWAEPEAQSGDVQLPGAFKRTAAGIVTRQNFDWQGVCSPQHSWADTILYETHVRGLTIHPSSNVRHRGQYRGVVEKIPYLQSLGITALELQPVQAFVRGTSGTADSEPGPVDYWGYNPMALFAPHSGYSSGERVEAPLTEFKTMVRELHRAGIEVILDVVFNHTGEAGADGPVYSFRGLDNAIYYLLASDGASYLDYTGCGNTLNCNQPIVRSLIIDCLRHWVVHFHIDGFRFDLAAVLGRGEDGAMLASPPILEQIAEDPILRNTKLIAEAWDTGGAFQVGRFASARWGEWNCHFRDEIRRFWRGDPGMSGAFATRLCGSADLYQRNGQTPLKSVNFITSHDGFTLRDLCSYADKHNESNGQRNADGMNENYSANYGVEGPALDSAINELRTRQAKNFLTTLFMARGVPMLVGGDEFGRSQRGNNNAYCQDNDLSWYDWVLAELHVDMLTFVRRLTELRKRHAVVRADRFYADTEIKWLGTDGQAPDWQGPFNQVGCLVRGDVHTLCLLFNAATTACEFRLPAEYERTYLICIDTSRAPPNDAPVTDRAAVIREKTIALSGRSSMVLQSL